MSKFKPKIAHPCKIPGFSIGYRFPQEYSTPNPGPLHYKDVQLYPLNRGPRIGSEKRDISFVTSSDGPGPAAYNLSQSLSEARSLRRGSRSVCAFNSSAERNPLLMQQSTEQVGPGEYDVQKSWIDLPDYKMNPTFATFVSTRSWPINASPGPAAYDVICDWAAKLKPLKSGTMGFSERDFLGLSQKLQESLSGPTYYKYNNFDDKAGRPVGPIIGTADREGLEKKDETPGPGAYPIKRTLEKQRSYQSFASAPKRHFALDGELPLNPGPGEYDIKRGAIGRNGAKFGTAKKRGLEFPSPTKAGPGAYNYPDSFRELTKKRNLEVERIRRAILMKKYTKTPSTENIHSKMHDSLHDETALKENKDIAILTKRSPSPKTVRDKPSFIDEIIHNSATPGPIYKIEYNSIEGTLGQKGSKLGFGHKDSYLPDKRNIPGPGIYSINRELIDLNNDHPTVARAQRTTLIPVNAMHVPGVGSYDVKTLESSKGVIFPRSKRLIEKIKEKKEKTELDELLERKLF